MDMQYVPILVLALIRTLIVDHQKKQMGFKDERLKLMNQVLSGIKVLKLYAWEHHFEKKLLALREEELKYLRRNQLIGAFTFMMFFSTPFIVSVCYCILGLN